MIIERGPLLAALAEVSPGLSNKENIEQSDAFVFKDGKLTTFNNEILCRTDSPLDFDAAVNAADLQNLLNKIPDEQIEIFLKQGEIFIKGKRKSAGIAVAAEIALPVFEVPMPEKWSRLAEGAATALQQAARTCNKDESLFLATCVHVTPTRIEGSDNMRLLRIEGETGFPEEVLIPATSIAAIQSIELKKVAQSKGWVHFKTVAGTILSCRCSHDSYHRGLDKIFELEDSESITLPGNLAEMIGRAEVFNEGAYDAKVGIRIAEGELTITSRKDGGWYEERKGVKYSGRELNFEINPKFLCEVLERTRDILVDNRKLKIVSPADRIQFVCSLRPAKERTERDEPKKPTKEEREAYKNRPPIRDEDIPF